VAIVSESVRTRYGTRRAYVARCSVPGCSFRGPRHYKASLAKEDEQRHYRQAHPRPG